MRYSVIIGGQECGPADIATLKSWIAEGRITKDTELKGEMGSIVKANTVFPELNQPRESPAGAPAPAIVGSIGAPPTVYVAYPREVFSDAGKSDFRIAQICLVAAIFCVPILFDIMAIEYARKAKAQGYRSALCILIIAWIHFGIMATIILLLVALSIWPPI